MLKRFGLDKIKLLTCKNSEPNQDVETYTVKAVTSREEAEKLMALGYEFHYRTQDGVDLFRKKVIGLD
jgi:hypothetical protein